MTTIANANEPLIVAIDTTASMALADAPDGQMRHAYARARLDELLRGLPQDTRVTLLSFGPEPYEYGRDMPAWRAAELLPTLQFMSATAETGRVIEWCLREYLRGQQRATLLLVTDSAPDDTMRYEAWTHYNRHLGNPLAVHVLTLGGSLGAAIDWNLSGERHSVAALQDADLMVGKPASRPPEGDFARAPTQPPSVAPPQPKNALRHADNEYVTPAKHAPAAKPKGKYPAATRDVPIPQAPERKGSKP